MPKMRIAKKVPGLPTAKKEGRTPYLPGYVRRLI